MYVRLKHLYKYFYIHKIISMKSTLLDKYNLLRRFNNIIIR